MSKKLTDDQKDQVMALRKQGLPFKDIAKKLKLGKSTCERVIREANPVVIKSHSEEMSLLQQAMAELKERMRLVKSRDGLRGRLFAYCVKHKLTRGDLKIVFDRLPKTRLTRKDREARLLKKGSGP